MAEDKTDKMMTAMVMAIVGVSVLSMVVTGMAPAPPTFECPLGDGVFYTYDELYEHFTTTHPTQPIDIIWE